MAHKQCTEIKIGLTKQEMGETRIAVLELTTDKSLNGSIKSSASVFWHSEGSREHDYALGSFGQGDFEKNLQTTRGRATQKAIFRQHSEVFTSEGVTQLTSEARAFYDRRGEIEHEV